LTKPNNNDAIVLWAVVFFNKKGAEAPRARTSRSEGTTDRPAGQDPTRQGQAQKPGAKTAPAHPAQPRTPPPPRNRSRGHGSRPTRSAKAPSQQGKAQPGSTAERRRQPRQPGQAAESAQRKRPDQPAPAETGTPQRPRAATPAAKPGQTHQPPPHSPPGQARQGPRETRPREPRQRERQTGNRKHQRKEKRKARKTQAKPKQQRGVIHAQRSHFHDMASGNPERSEPGAPKARTGLSTGLGAYHGAPVDWHPPARYTRAYAIGGVLSVNECPIGSAIGSLSIAASSGGQPQGNQV
jgi:hypothetical protein